MKRLNSTRLGRLDLLLRQRQEIFRLRFARLSIQKIGELVGCSKSTVSDTLNHLSLSKHHAELDWSEKGKIVHDSVRRNRGRPRNRYCVLKSPTIEEKVRVGLEDKKSPITISLEIKNECKGDRVSHEAIYQFIYNKDRSLIKYLIRAGNRSRRNRVSGRKERIKSIESTKRNISDRAQEGEERTELGHFESDFIVSGRGGRSCLLVVVDRKARRVFLRKTANREADTARRAIFQIFKELPSGARKSLTVDNDTAHNHLPMLEAVFKEDMFQVLYCDPYAAWQRGTVEAVNGVLRRWWPKKTNFDEVTEHEVQRVQDWFNNRSMRVLGGKTPNQVFQDELRKAA